MSGVREGLPVNVLVVEDERSLADAICHILESEGYVAQAAYDGNEGLALARQGGYAAIVLDLMLPGVDGLELVRTLRASGDDVPVLMLTARSQTADKVSGLDAGADDYMTKPFEAVELLARLRALTRRTHDEAPTRLSFGDLALDLSSHDLSCNGQQVHLSQKEFDVMRQLMSGTGRVVSKQDLLEGVWGGEANATENSVEAYVSFLRKKIAHLGSSVSITTLRMLGYRLEELRRA
jgi:DNA-binding response OmpR family regulator